jgi:hypothetical protein
MVEEELVPIRIDLDIDGYKYRDTFTWNFNGTQLDWVFGCFCARDGKSLMLILLPPAFPCAADRVMDPEKFAEITCAELELPQNFVQAIAISIREQLDEYVQPENGGELAELRVPINVRCRASRYESRSHWRCLFFFLRER